MARTGSAPADRTDLTRRRPRWGSRITAARFRVPAVALLTLLFLGLHTAPPAALLGAVTRATTDQGSAAGTTGPYQLGVISSNSALADALTGRRVHNVVVQASWRWLQPGPQAPLAEAALQSLRADIATYRRAGLRVVLDPGLQYPPGWVWDLPGARFQDQYGDQFAAAADSGDDVPDGVHSTAVRQAQTGYLRRLAAAVGPSTFDAVRVGGLLSGELRYPGPGYRGHPDSWWAFSASAQAGTPTPGWVPERSARDPVLAGRFLADYLGDLVDFAAFLVRTVGEAFTGRLQVMLPSFGVRPGDRAEALCTGLDGSSPRASELVMGVDFDLLLAGLTTMPQTQPFLDRLVAYTTWIDGPSFGSSPQATDPASFLAEVARGYGIPVAGENTASSARSPAAFSLSTRRASALGLTGLTWFDDRGLVGLLPRNG